MASSITVNATWFEKKTKLLKDQTQKYREGVAELPRTTDFGRLKIISQKWYWFHSWKYISIGEAQMWKLLRMQWEIRI